MDVRLPDGTVIKNVPEGTTKAQLTEKLKANGYDISTLEEKPSGFAGTTSGKVLGYLSEAAGNVPQDVMNIAQGAYNVATDPLQALQGVAEAVGSPLQTGAQLLGGAYQVARHPLETFKNAPVSTVLGVSMAAPIARGIGAVTLEPTAAVANRFVSPLLKPVLQPEAAAVENIMAKTAQPREFAAAMQQAPEVTPGAPVATASQRAVAAGLSEPAVAGMEANLMNVSEPYGRDIFKLKEQRLSAIQDQLTRVDQQLKTRAKDMSPEARGELRSVRDSLMQQLATEQAGLETQARGVAQRLPETGQRMPGETLAGRAETLQRETRQERVRPVFRQAFREAGNAPIDTTGVIRRTEQILGRPLTEFAPETAPQTVRLLQNLPEQASLRQLDEVRKAVGLDIAGAERSMAPGAAQTLPNLYGVYDAIRTAIARSPELPNTARNLYNRGLQMHREEVIPRFRTGVVRDILRTTGKNEPGLLPDRVVKTFLQDERGAQQFATTYRNDPLARQAMLTGVEDLARKAVVDPTTRMVNPEAIDKFIADHGRQLNIMGVDANTILQPIRAEAARLQTGMERLAEQARIMRKASPAEVVDEALKSAPNMDFLQRRLRNSPEALEALNKEVSDRALNLIRSGDPEAAMKYLDKNEKPLRMVLSDQYGRIRGLVRTQQQTAKIAKEAPLPDKKMTIQLDNTFTPAQLTDLRVVADEIKRLNEVDQLAGVRRAPGVTKLGAEAGVSSEDLPNTLSRNTTLIKSIIDKFQKISNRRMVLKTADLLVKDPERLGQLIEDALNKQQVTKVKRKTTPSEMIRGAVTLQNALNPQQNRNAMAR